MPIRITVFLLLAALAGLAQSSPHWRFWDARDGMPETFTQQLALDASGRIWAGHGGAVLQFSIYDGYQIHTLPLPEAYTRVFPGHSDVWAVTPNGLFRLENERWVHHPVPQFDSNLPASQYPGQIAVPRSDGKVYLLRSGVLLEYTAPTRDTRVVATALQLRLGPLIHMI